MDDSDGVTPRTLVDAVLRQRTVSDNELRPARSKHRHSQDTPPTAARLHSSPGGRRSSSRTSNPTSLRKRATMRNFMQMQSAVNEPTPKTMIRAFLDQAPEETPLLPRSQPVDLDSDDKDGTNSEPTRRRRSLHADSFLGMKSTRQKSQDIRVPEQITAPVSQSTTEASGDASRELPARKKRSLHEDSFIGSKKGLVTRSPDGKRTKKPRPGTSYTDFVAGIHSQMQNLQDETDDPSSEGNKEIRSSDSGASMSRRPMITRRSDLSAAEDSDAVPPTDPETDLVDPILYLNDSLSSSLVSNKEIREGTSSSKARNNRTFDSDSPKKTVDRQRNNVSVGKRDALADESARAAQDATQDATRSMGAASGLQQPTGYITPHTVADPASAQKSRYTGGQTVGDNTAASQYDSVFSTSRMTAGESSSYDRYSAMVTPVLATSTRQTPASFKLPPNARAKTSLTEQNAKQRNKISGPSKKAPAPKKTYTKRPPAEGLPRSLTKSIFSSFFTKRLRKDTLDAVEDLAKEYWQNVTTDLEAYARHAGRASITEDDVELLMKRQRFVTEKQSMYELVEKYLPMEYRKEIIPVARSGNKVVPKK